MENKNKDLENRVAVDGLVKTLTFEKVLLIGLLTATLFYESLVGKYGSLNNAYNQIRENVSCEIQKTSNANFRALYP